MKSFPQLPIAAFILGVALIISSAVFTLERKSDYITVGGQAEIPIQPDLAILYLTITTSGQTPEETQDANSDLASDVKNALRTIGVAEANIETSYYYLDKRVEWTSEGAIDRGYELVNTLKVSTPIALAPAALDTALDNGVTRVSTIEYFTSQTAKRLAVAEALKAAAISAKTKADTVALAMDARLGRVLKIEEGNWWIVPASELAELPPLAAEYADSAILPQRMAVQTNINVVFALMS